MSDNSGDHISDHKEGYQPNVRINEVAQKFLDDLEQEKRKLNQNEFPLCVMLIDDGKFRHQNSKK